MIIVNYFKGGEVEKIDTSNGEKYYLLFYSLRGCLTALRNFLRFLGIF